VSDRGGAPHGRRQSGSGPRAEQTPDRTSYYSGVRLKPGAYHKAHQAAEALNLSLSGYLAELVERDQVDDDGRPLWAERPDQPALIDRRSA
jgi:hypothetical protein